MNLVELTGRAARDPEVRQSPAGSTIAWLTLAVDKEWAVKGSESSANFIKVTCFNKTAQLVDRYVKKGRLLGVTGRIDTGFYEKNGQRVYTTDIVANRIEFLSRNVSEDKHAAAPAIETKEEAAAIEEAVAEAFEKASADDTPF